MLTAFSISGYKAYRHADVELAPLTLVYGQNSAGKSTIIEALQLARTAVRYQLGSNDREQTRTWAQFVAACKAFQHKGRDAEFRFGLRTEDEELVITYTHSDDTYSPHLVLTPREHLLSVVEPVVTDDDTEEDPANDATSEYLTRFIEASKSVTEYCNAAVEDPTQRPPFPTDADWSRVPFTIPIAWFFDDDHEHGIETCALLGSEFAVPLTREALLNDPSDAPDALSLVSSHLLPISLAAYFAQLLSSDEGLQRFLRNVDERVIPEIARTHEYMTDQVRDELRVNETLGPIVWAWLYYWAQQSISADFESLTHDEHGNAIRTTERPVRYTVRSVERDGGRVRQEIEFMISPEWEALEDPMYAIGDALRLCLIDDLNERLNSALAMFDVRWESIGPVRRRPGWFEDIPVTSTPLNLGFPGTAMSVGDDGHRFPEVIHSHRAQGLEFRVNSWLKTLGVPYEYSNGTPEEIYEEQSYGAKRLTALRFRPRLFDESRCDDDGDPIEVGFEDVGYGLNQILPIITQLCAPLPQESLVTIQQPELHIHPKLQTELADLFLEATMTNAADPAFPPKQVIVETHSEHVLLRIQRRIREGKVDPSHVAVLYVDIDNNGESVVHRIRLGDKGEFLDEWPDGFFGERLMEILGY